MKALVPKVEKCLRKRFLSAFLFICLVFVTGGQAVFAENPSAAQIEKSREAINEAQSLRQKLDIEPKLFIKNIQVIGSSLAEDKIKEITLAFEKKWLNKSDIEQIVELFKSAYTQMNKPEPNISYQLKQLLLEINIKEQNTGKIKVDR